MRQYNITVEHEDGSATQYLNVPASDASRVLAGATTDEDVTGYVVRLAGAKPARNVTPRTLVPEVALSGSSAVPPVVVHLVIAYAHLRRLRHERALAEVERIKAEGRSPIGPPSAWFNREDLLAWFDTFPLPRDLVDTGATRGGRLSPILRAMAGRGLLLAPSGDEGWRLP
ncbi:MAG TPA: hypothetical protein VIU37_05355 [Candidatus Limnocylindrales bacterium]